MAGVRRRKRPAGGFYREWEGWYIDRFGARKFFKGFDSKRETYDVAYEKESRERKMRVLGTLEPAILTEVSRVLDEYIAWGESKGGRDGGPWNATHAGMRKAHLDWFLKELGIRVVGELDGKLLQVEKLLRRLKDEGRKARTVFSYGESLKAFSSWCTERSYLSADPMGKLRLGQRRPERRRRALSMEEFHRLLAVASDDAQVLYLVAATTGFRANELRSLRVDSMRLENQSLYLGPEYTKNRKAAEQPLPSGVWAKLVAYAAGRNGGAPLLSITTHPARALRRDLTAAEITRETSDGAIDFHSLRVTYVTWLAESGAHPGEVQDLARHATPDLTFGVYARSGMTRKRAALNTVGDALSGTTRP